MYVYIYIYIGYNDVVQAGMQIIEAPAAKVSAQVFIIADSHVQVYFFYAFLLSLLLFLLLLFYCFVVIMMAHIMMAASR